MVLNRSNLNNVNVIVWLLLRPEKKISDLASVCRFKSQSYKRHLAAFLAGAGGTPRLSYLPCKR